MNDSTQWYRQLKKPSWTPGENVFGHVWTPLYIIIFIVNIYVLKLLLNKEINFVVALPFWLNIFFNLIYTPIQFGLRNNYLASIDIILVLFTIIWSMIAMWPHSKLVSLAFSPYLIWVCIATALQFSITFLNR